eukprot:UN02634
MPYMTITERLTSAISKTSPEETSNSVVLRSIEFMLSTFDAIYAKGNLTTAPGLCPVDLDPPRLLKRVGERQIMRMNKSTIRSSWRTITEIYQKLAVLDEIKEVMKIPRPTCPFHSCL